MDRHIRLSGIFRNMKNRCNNPNNKDYIRYGNRGIKVCDEWLNSEQVHTKGKSTTQGFLAFEQWAITNGYSNELTLDRIDNNKGYSPENCHWVSKKAQANNTRRNRNITYKGRTQSLAQWCRELNLNYRTVKSRLNQCRWTVKRAFEVL